MPEKKVFTCPSREEILKSIESLMRERGFDDPISESSKLEVNLGLDSLGRIELFMGLEEIYDLDITDSDIDPFGGGITIGNVINIVIADIEKKNQKPLP